MTLRELDLATLRRSQAYGLLTSFIVPRPIAWVSTVDRSGRTNLAPFSYFTGLGSDPPMVSLGIANRRDGTEKDTLRNARETGCLCINLVEVPSLEEMVASSEELPHEVSEVERLGLATEPCRAIPGVRLTSARASLECRLVDVHTYGRAARTNLVVAEVLHATFDEAVAHPDGLTLDDAHMAPIARLGGDTYATLGARMQRRRP